MHIAYESQLGRERRYQNITCAQKDNGLRGCVRYGIHLLLFLKNGVTGLKVRTLEGLS